MKRSVILKYFMTVILLAGCGPGQLTEGEANKTLSSVAESELSFNCHLHPKLATKPEFVELLDIKLCVGRIEITGLRLVSETEIVVEWRPTYEPNIDVLKVWMKAMDSLLKRLEIIPAVQATPRFEWHYYFTDNSDGTVYNQNLTSWAFSNPSTNVFSANRPNIASTEAYLELISLKQMVQNMQNGTNQLIVRETPFSLYSDGWRISNDAYKYNIPNTARDINSLYKTELAKSWFHDDHFEESFIIFKRNAERGEAEAQFYAGGMLLDGKGVEREIRDGVFWIKASASQGHLGAMSLLIDLYNYGCGLDHDKALAVELFDKLISIESSYSFTEIGRAYVSEGCEW